MPGLGAIHAEEPDDCERKLYGIAESLDEGEVATMAMPQRDEKIEAIKRLEPPSRKRYGGPGALLEYAVMHNDEAEAARLRAELRRLTEEI